ncbi:MAG: RNA-binding protein [Nitrospira sp. CG24D]|nr:MAG: RNA-binding protein [Nitrospira sp. CG24D]
MNTHIHVSGLSFFCTDDELRQSFIPFGAVVLAQVLRDDNGHSLGVGIVHMASVEDVDRVFDAHQRFEVAGSRVNLWEPADGPGSSAEQIGVYGLRATGTAQTGPDVVHGKLHKAVQFLAEYLRKHRRHPALHHVV